ncbi:MAG: tripartite tricarboxylate transporter TctB family protein [Spirochaetales bacterium]
MPRASIRLNQEILIGIICLTVSVVILSITPSFPQGKANIGLTGPAFFPDLLAIVFIGCGLYQIVHGIIKKKEYPPLTFSSLKHLFDKKETRTAYFVILLVVGFIFLLDWLGFLLTTSIFLLLFMGRLGVPKLQNLLYTFIFTLTIYLLFGYLFTISLPSGILAYLGL